ncbi:MAG: DNA repair protein RadA [Pseudomonadota bacterium]
MARNSRSFICQSCGAVHGRWAGKCDSCGAWNTIVEETTTAAPVAPGGKTLKKGRKTQLVALDGDTEEAVRIPSGICELDRVTGGGFVAGSALLVGGDPGIGKSTLLIQAAAAMAAAGRKAVYISGEEAIGQVRLRADRLGLIKAPVQLAAETHVEDILATLKAEGRIALVVIDSIQTLWTGAVEAAPGTVTQVRTCAQALIRFAKESGSTIVLVGHVTKEGQIAGPRVVEHMVDAVLYFEGDATHHFRILRAVKNRFGATDEIGVFEMTGTGLGEVTNPSALFLGDRDAAGTTGVAVFAGVEGTRPILVEIQALVAPSSLGTPRRSVVGWESNRLAMIVAVLEAHAGVRLGGHDIYLNVAGGMRIVEPAADLAVAAALVSSLTGAALPPERVFFGEVSLAGSVRPVAHTEIRLREAEKLGFKSAIIPPARAAGGTDTGLAHQEIADITRLVADIAASAA